MTITQQQTFNPPFSNPDDMPEYVSIYEMKPKRRVMTQEKAQKNRDNYKRWYAENSEYVLLKKKLIRESKREQ